MSMTDTVEKIYKASLKFLEPLSPEQTYRRIVEQAVKLVGGVDGRIVLKDGPSLKNVYTMGRSLTKYPLRRKGYTYRSFKKRRAFVIHARDFKSIYPEAVDEGFKSSIFIPLYYKKKSFGVLMVRSTKLREFSEAELEILKLFGNMASLAIRKTHLLKEAERNISLRDRFIALATHELRTPLTSMFGYIQLLQKRLAGKKSLEAQWSETLMAESKRLISLIEEVLDITKITAGSLQYQFEETNLKKILREAVRQINETYPNRKVKLVFGQTGHRIAGDYRRLVKAVVNVIENGLKFSDERQPVEISLGNGTGFYKIVVRDYGQGIPKEDLPYIFESFYKGGSDEAEGSGIGLFYTKNVVERQQGHIHVDSVKGQGTTVSIHLPKVHHVRKR